MHAYAQARAAAEVAVRRGESLLAIDGCYAEVLTRRIEQSGGILDLCHPTIARMWREGGAKDRELVRCLTGYLLAGRNFSEASRTLYLHRNTLIYRIERIGELLGSDLSAKSLPADELLFLTVSCLLVARMDGEAPRDDGDAAGAAVARDTR